MEKIESVKNEYIKWVCKLKTASGRKETGLFTVEGAKLCIEAINSGWKIDKCLATEAYLSLFQEANLEAKTILISEAVSKKISAMDTAPGCMIILKQQDNILPMDQPPFILALDHLADPANLGAILRSAEAFGAGMIYLSEGSVDLYSLKVLRAAMGSAFRAPIRKGNLVAFLQEKRQQGYQILGAGLDRSFLKLPQVSFKSPTVVVIGNESNGITEEIMEQCSHGVFIPMIGKNESLNASVAASIILWEQSKWR